MTYILFLIICYLLPCILASTRITKDAIDLITQTENSGNWFILYSHPPALEPFETSFEYSWEVLAESFQDWKKHGVYFGRVDCAIETELCSATDSATVVKILENGKVTDSYQVKTQEEQEQVNTFLRKRVASGSLRGSVSLTRGWLETVKSSGHPWFIKFYAPWCGHCKSLEPIWETLASTNEDAINIGEVNCEQDKDLCTLEKIGGLPTLKFVNSGSSFIYNGLRELDDFKKYMTKMTGPPTQSVDYSSLQSIYANPVSLIYIHKKEADLTSITMVASKYLDSVPFYTTVDVKLISALGVTLEKNEDSKAILVKDGGAIRQIFNVKEIQSPSASLEENYIEWVNNNKYPLVVRINSGNANNILKGDRLVTLLFLSDDLASDEFRSLARQWLTTSSSPVIFAELDGKAWAGYVKRVYNFSTDQLPAIVIVDPLSKIYFNQDLNGEPFSLTSAATLFEALQHTDQLEGQSISPRSDTFIQKVVYFVGDHSFLFGIGLLALCGLIFAVVTSTGDELIPRLSAKEPTATEKAKKDN